MVIASESHGAERNRVAQRGHRRKVVLALSAFQLLPTAPFRIRNLGGTTFASGLFLGFLTYASALSAPFTGALADRIGRRRAMLIASAVITLCSVGYAATSSVR